MFAAAVVWLKPLLPSFEWSRCCLSLNETYAAFVWMKPMLPSFEWNCCCCHLNEIVAAVVWIKSLLPSFEWNRCCRRSNEVVVAIVWMKLLPMPSSEYPPRRSSECLLPLLSVTSNFKDRNFTLEGIKPRKNQRGGVYHRWMREKKIKEKKLYFILGKLDKNMNDWTILNSKKKKIKVE